MARASSIITTGHDIDGKCSSSVVIFDLMPNRWICTDVCSISTSATDHDTDGRCSSSVVVLIYYPLGGPSILKSVRLVMILMVSVQAVLLYISRNPHTLCGHPGVLLEYI